jgi:serine/threonine protein phosphatase PrpC
MRVWDAITTPGGVRTNEDRTGHRGSLAWVIDGATDLYADSALPAESDVQWLVDFIGQRLTEAGAANYQGPAAALLDGIAREVHGELAALRFPADRMPPACSLVVVIDRPDSYEITRIGDATAVVTGRTPTTLGTSYFDRREAAGVAARRDGASPDEVVAAMQRRRLHTMTAGDGESVFSGHPRRRLQPHTVIGPWGNADGVLLCTDGFARLVTDYGLYAQWSEVVSDARDKGLAYLEKLIRETESGPVEETPGRFKRADDVAAVFLTP